MSNATLLIAADVVPMAGNFAAFSTDASQLLQDGLKELWLSAGARVFNLECPLTDGNTPIEKCGPALSAPTVCATGLAQLKPDGICICNNHIFDHGEPGLRSTMGALHGEQLSFFGAGSNAPHADNAQVLEVNGMRVGLYAVCEHEFSCATDRTPGANAFDPLEIADRIRALKSNCDRLVVLYHGGREYYPYPSPLLQKRCRKMATSGADAVICQHSHCIGSYETFAGCTIVYGQGNFLFDMDDEPCFDTGLLVRLTFDGEQTTSDFIPVCRAHTGARLAQGDEAKAILGAFLHRSEELTQPDFVENRYQAYATEKREKLLKVFLSGNPMLKAVNVLYGRRPSRVYSRETQLAIKNSLMCESINECLIRGI